MENHNVSICASNNGLNCATFERSSINYLVAKISDMANTLDPMDLKQIITLQLDGFSNRKIGFTLGISRNTVNAYMTLFRASDYSFKELLAFDSAALVALFPSYSTIDNQHNQDLMLYFEGVSITGISIAYVQFFTILIYLSVP